MLSKCYCNIQWSDQTADVFFCFMKHIKWVPSHNCIYVLQCMHFIGNIRRRRLPLNMKILNYFAVRVGVESLQEKKLVYNFVHSNHSCVIKEISFQTFVFCSINLLSSFRCMHVISEVNVLKGNVDSVLEGYLL